MSYPALPFIIYKWSIMIYHGLSYMSIIICLIFQWLGSWGGEKMLETMVFSWFFNVSKSIKFRGFARPKWMVDMVGSDVGTMVALWKIMG